MKIDDIDKFFSLVKKGNVKARYLKHQSSYITNLTDYDNRRLNNENTTNLNFKTWLALYNADPDNWMVFIIDCLSLGNTGLVPAYNLDSNLRPNYQFIKFISKRDYRKWEKFVIKQFKNGADRDNIQEILKMSDTATKRAQARHEKLQKEIEKAYEDLINQSKGSVKYEFSSR